MAHGRRAAPTPSGDETLWPAVTNVLGRFGFWQGKARQAGLEPIINRSQKDRPMTDDPKVQRALDIYKRDGVLTPDAVIEDARDPDSPLHDLFEWDDSKAAHEYRRVTARSFIRSIEVRIIQPAEPVVRVSMFVRDVRQSHDKQGYRHIDDVGSDAALAVASLQAEWERVNSALIRYRSLCAYLGRGDEMEHIIERFSNMKPPPAPKRFAGEVHAAAA